MNEFKRISFSKRKYLSVISGLVLAAISFAATTTNATVISLGSAPGNDLGEINSASVSFGLTVSGTITNLVITLTNTATYDPNDPVDILTGVFFTLSGNPALAPSSAVVALGSGVKNGTTDPGGVVGGEWAYASSLNTNNANQGTSSAGLGIFGPANLFPGSNLQGPVSPDGVQYGISTRFDTPGNDNGGISGVGLITNSVVFTLGNVPASLRESDISSVTFQYGTALSEPTIPGTPVTVIPEPSAIALSVAGICLLGLLGRKRR